MICFLDIDYEVSSFEHSPSRSLTWRGQPFSLGDCLHSLLDTSVVSGEGVVDTGLYHSDLSFRTEVLTPLLGVLLVVVVFMADSAHG